MEVYVVYYTWEYEHYASQSTCGAAAIELVLNSEQAVKDWAKEQKLSLSWSNGKGQAGKYTIEKHPVKIYTTNH